VGDAFTTLVQLPAGGAEGETGCVRILRDLDASGSPFRSRNVWVGGLWVAFFSSAIYSIERFDARPAVRCQLPWRLVVQLLY
jgi:hypothetical protein